MQKKIREAHKRSKERKEKRQFNSIIELIEIFSKDYLEIHSSMEIDSPFGGKITLGKFDNSGKRPLQLKLSSSGGTNLLSAFPGTTSKGDAWTNYDTWVFYLDQIDSINRDYYVNDNVGFFSLNKTNKIQTNDDFENLIKHIDDYKEALEEEDDSDTKQRLNTLIKVAKQLKQGGKFKKQLALTLIRCLKWAPEDNTIKYNNVDSIPNILSTKIQAMRDDLNLRNALQPTQARYTSLKKALIEYNTIFKSTHVLNLIDNMGLRKAIRTARNRTEAYHQLQGLIRKIYRGVFKGRKIASNQISAHAVRLVANAIIAYNAIILNTVYERMLAEGVDKVTIDEFARISPIAWSHIAFTGKYNFKKSNGDINIDAMVNELEKHLKRHFWKDN